jgi:hypothetical protein
LGFALAVSVRLGFFFAFISACGFVGVFSVRSRTSADVLYVLAMVVIMLGVDILFFRNRFWERPMVNIGVVLVFAAFYLRFFGHP